MLSSKIRDPQTLCVDMSVVSLLLLHVDCAPLLNLHCTQLLDQDPVLAYLTDRYRRVAYVLSALEQESRSGVGLNVSRLELKTRMLLAQLEEAFTDKPTLQVLSAYFKVCTRECWVC